MQEVVGCANSAQEQPRPFGWMSAGKNEENAIGDQDPEELPEDRPVAGRSDGTRIKPWYQEQHNDRPNMAAACSEWYLLPFYAILKSIPNKLLGVAAMFGSIVVLFLVPWLDTSPVRSARYRPIFRQFFWVLVADCILLVFAGGHPPEGTWLLLSRVGAAYYFLHFLVALPLVGVFERLLPLPKDSISGPVLSGQHLQKP